MKKASSIFTRHAFMTYAIANGATTVAKQEETIVANQILDREPLWYMRPINIEPVRMDAQTQRQHKYTGCKSAGCRTLKTCICRCKDCTRWCKYRGVTIVDTDGTVFIRFESGRLIISMPRSEYEEVKHHWEKLELKLVEAPSSGVTPV